ncbi:nucleotidyl transferase AbiEii/AbiGii toxin family protein [Sphingobacterium faecale]|uniref:Nucleotidyl transferase AbiEii/AbiGii toxin family protein n=1 Tax=Sphingobacterium faecale TaxID=2803775 RepID=A0ABS1RBN4_9SPHI|nr:nucleotidyl transferase AbiEii/AbiGii toxin family protein [Sphingobacterium faecale]MBL1411427.1 nucleotidyl transferase AbiEii/AbiGii toxin family protein [Sphingobacterium faecale]
MWINLSDEQKLQILEQVENAIGLPAFVVEKDWWVCIILKAVFQSRYADSIIFKGGTSLSKAYNLINRFSEDIDLIIDHHLLGFDQLGSKSQIKKLRKASGGFIINEFREELVSQLDHLGVDRELYEIRYNDHIDDTSDPNTLEIHYRSVVPTDNVYIQQRILLEMGARSLTEPFEIKSVISFLDHHYRDLDFTEPSFGVQVVIPTRTFIEKVLLLHEEFSKPVDKIRTDRLTRHLYDLDKIMDAEYGEMAIDADELFNTIVHHRKTVTPLRGMDYSNHVKGKLSIIPPDAIMAKWEADYKTMQENMIIGDSLNWSELLGRIWEIEKRFNRIILIP